MKIHLIFMYQFKIFHFIIINLDKYSYIQETYNTKFRILILFMLMYDLFIYLEIPKSDNL